MRFLEATLPTPEENLALDEALLDEAERLGPAAETLRLWEPANYLVVVGRTSRLAAEVHAETCHADRVPVVRRSSGGAAIVAGPGCLMYAVALHYAERPELRMLDRAHAFVLETLVAALSRFVAGAARAGTSDLALDGYKFSGNSLRCKREAFLYHGTLLYDFDLTRVARYLGHPPREPDYRASRGHDAFMRNFPATRDKLQQALVSAFRPDESTEVPRDAVARLVADRYGRREWHEER